MSSNIRNIAATVVNIVVATARNIVKDSNFRESLALRIASDLDLLREAQGAKFNLDKSMSNLMADYRQQVRDKFTKATNAAHDGYSDKDRPTAIAEGAVSEDVAILHSALSTLKVRGSEAKKLYGAFIAGNATVAKFYAGEGVTVTTALASLAAKQDAPEGGETGEGGDDAGEGSDLSARDQWIQQTKIALSKGVTLDDMLAILAEVAEVPATVEV